MLVLWEDDNGDLIDQKLQIGKAYLCANKFFDNWFQRKMRHLRRRNYVTAVGVHNTVSGRSGGRWKYIEVGEGQGMTCR